MEENSPYDLLKKLFPLCRSLTGDGNRETLRIIQELIPLKVAEIPSGSEVFDWTVPQEWNIRDAWIKDSRGNTIVDFRNNNLHVMGYSAAVDQKIPLEELQQHLYSLPQLPDAIPYITSYYKERWGFCLPHRLRENLQSGDYFVYIDSEYKAGYLTYGECYLPGEEAREILLSTYICHPSLANDNLSGVVVTVFLVKWLLSLPRRYSYRILFIPETIGSIAYLHSHLAEMKEKTVAGFVLTCCGDTGGFSYLSSRNGNTLSDRAVRHVLKHKVGKFTEYTFLERGSDERQFCSPGVDLPVGSLMRSKYGTFPQYHNSLDNLEFVHAQALEETLAMYREVLSAIELNRTYQIKTLCEPRLGKYGLYPSVSTPKTIDEIRIINNLVAYLDGKKDLLAVAETIGSYILDCFPVIAQLLEKSLIKEIGTEGSLGKVSG